jgi:enoyl-[acyl-carrier protein] reductase III
MLTGATVKLPPLDGWAVVLGASSGFGAAGALALARAGVDIVGVHLDRRSTVPAAERVVAAVRSLGREAWFFNVNAADAAKRNAVLDEIGQRFAERGRGEQVRVLLHSLAFGSLRPFLADGVEDRISDKQLKMTCDVMAHSLVYWTQSMLDRELLSDEGRIFALTSTGAREVWGGYGAVSAAKAALESHVRQLARELAPRGVTVNAICAGVTDTPALAKIPERQSMVDKAIRKNPVARLGTPEDVASALVALAQPCTYWMTGGVIHVDGGEAHCG